MSIDAALVRRLSLFSQMKASELEVILATATSRRVAQGQAVFDQGAVADTFYLLLHGRLKVQQVTTDGQQLIVRVVHPGDLFGFARALRRDDYPGTAFAAVDSVVLGWPNSHWDRLIASNPQLAVNAMQTIGERLDEAHTRIREMSTQDVERRVAHAVLRLAEKAGMDEASGTRIDFPLSRQDIAELTGTTLHTVSRILSAWEVRGLVEGGRQKVILRDRDGLSRLAESADGE